MRKLFLALALSLVIAGNAWADEFTTPQERVDHHIKVAKQFVRDRDYKAAFLEYATLIANGGTSKKALKELEKLRKKAELTEDEAKSLREGVVVSGPSAAVPVEVKSRHYLLRTNVDDPKALLKRLDALVGAWMKTWGKPLGAKKSRLKKLRVHVWRAEADYRAYLGQDRPSNEKGYFSSDTRELFIYLGDDDQWCNLYHEATHQLFVVSGVQQSGMSRLPGFWVVEGVAIWMENLVWDGRKFTEGDLCHQRTRDAAASRSTWVSWGRLFQIGKDDFNTVGLYAQTAVAMKFFMDKHRKTFVEYVGWCLSAKGRSKLIKETFGKPLTEVVDGIDSWYEEGMK